MTHYLNLARGKRKTLNKLTKEEMELPMKEFIPCLYYNCTPSSYGIQFGKRIIKESNGFLRPVHHSSDNGDFTFFDPISETNKYGEFKISFKGINGKYRITNIRDHQSFDYFILCFVDTEDNFKPRFYVVPKEHVTDGNFFKLTAMNGTFMANLNNEVVPKAMTVNHEDMDWYFSQENIINGATYTKLKNFILNSKNHANAKI